MDLSKLCQYFRFKHNQNVISTEKVMDYFDAQHHLATSEPFCGCFTVVVCSGLELDSLSHKVSHIAQKHIPIRAHSVCCAVLRHPRIKSLVCSWDWLECLNMIHHNVYVNVVYAQTRYTMRSYMMHLILYHNKRVLFTVNYIFALNSPKYKHVACGMHVFMHSNDVDKNSYAI